MPNRRTIFLVSLAAIVPTLVTVLSLCRFSSRSGQRDGLSKSDFNQARTYGLRSWFSFDSPSAFFPASAIISLTDDNSTFFFARPAAFGASLEARGLSGQLWIGSGFVATSNLHDAADALAPLAQGELGCTDVPGWNDATVFKRRVDRLGETDHAVQKAAQTSESDGTDNHLHQSVADTSASKDIIGEQLSINHHMIPEHEIEHADIQSLQESAEIRNKIVLLSRGGCGFLEKTKWAQRRGASALIVGDDTPGRALVTMYAHGDTSNVSIPALFTSHTTAHLLSSLIPDKQRSDHSGKLKNRREISRIEPEKVHWTTRKPSIISSACSRMRKGTFPVFSRTSVEDSGTRQGTSRNGPFTDLVAWARSKSHKSPHLSDSWRPPSSGVLSWVDSKQKHMAAPQGSSPRRIEHESSSSDADTKELHKGFSQKGSVPTNDFVIGTHDWRDPDVLLQESMTTNAPGLLSTESTRIPAATSAKQSKPSNTGVVSPGDREPRPSGGSITPGSGEYGIIKNRNSKLSNGHESRKVSTHNSASNKVPDRHNDDKDNDVEKKHEGLWVTLTPTRMPSRSFFDSFFIMVISPLVTLSIVYFMLVLRNRLRRRRWRAPKSVVERLPVRTYHTHTSSLPSYSSTSSLPRVPSRAPFQAANDQANPTGLSNLQATTDQSVEDPTFAPEQSTPSRSLRGAPDVVQARSALFYCDIDHDPSAAATAATVHSEAASVQSNAAHQNHRLSHPHSEKHKSTISSSKAKPLHDPLKKYRNRQVECVVCLEEYVDGQSRVMSLPCGHEFHVECITPWLVTRRRTCPICKGDVVRSLNEADQMQTPNGSSSQHSSRQQIAQPERGPFASSSTSTNRDIISGEGEGLCEQLNQNADHQLAHDHSIEGNAPNASTPLLK